MQAIMIAMTLSVDALGLGVTYGVRGIRISNFAKALICFLTIIATSVSMVLGGILARFMPKGFSEILGALVLGLIGVFIIRQEMTTYNEETRTKKAKRLENSTQNRKILSFVIKSLGITIEIMRNSEAGDVDNSANIEPKEALGLGLALSIDCLCAGFAFALGGRTTLVPVLCAVFHWIFLSVGVLVGRVILCRNNAHSKYDERIFGVISGILIILMALIRIRNIYA